MHLNLNIHLQTIENGRQLDIYVMTAIFIRMATFFKCANFEI